MSKLKVKQDVIERYWPDYLTYCMRSQDSKVLELHKAPTVNGFWQWYITTGPMGVKHENRFYTTERVEYV